MTRPLFQFSAQQDVRQAGVAVEQCHLVIEVRSHDVLEHAVQGGDARSGGKQNEVLGRLVPRFREQPALRRVGHQLQPFGELAVDECAAS